MYKKQIIPAKTSGSVIKLKNYSKNSSSGKNGDSKHKNESAEISKRVEESEKLSHFHRDVPEQVQEFIKRISLHSEPTENKMERNVLSAPCESHDDICSGLVWSQSGVEVIVTTEFSPNNLSNSDYDKLKEDTRFTEFEIVQLWKIFKRDFPNGRINRNQLREIIKITFPRGNLPDLFIENIFRVFDPRYNGFIRFTDLLIAFSMSMKGTGLCSLGQFTMILSG